MLNKISLETGSLRPGRLWAPTLGEDISIVMDQVPEGAREVVKAEAVDVLAQGCKPDQGDDKKTGLVVGYVQSGKTLSFTVVSALARDNGFPLVIVLTGISKNLFEQSIDRLRDDLRLTQYRRRWKHYQSPLAPADANSIDATLRRWKEGVLEPETLLVTVMKHGTHLDSLIRSLRELNLSDVPVLVIDDEADQAGLNNDVKRGDQSPTYRRVLEIRSLLPRHSFLQYTATPQALLLINLIDQLSPDFAKVLTPGGDYVGGQLFFHGENEYVRIIPDIDLPTRGNRLLGAPPSLREAMRIFFLGVAVGELERARRCPPWNRSMLIHPSHLTVKHLEYLTWVQAAKALWVEILQEPEDSRDCAQLLSEFESSYQDLGTTVDDLPSFDKIKKILRHAIEGTVAREVNARATGVTQMIDWERDYAHILVGGAALDRGYTVEGLTVTYMPRGTGVKNADTIQQRARWFGYKAKYIGFCRVYLSEDTANAYRDYVEHEESVRKQLGAHSDAGKPLQDWRRAFFLSPDLKPTRSSVLSLDYMRGVSRDKWEHPDMPYESSDAARDNRSVIDKFVQSVAWSPDLGHPSRQAYHKHQVARDLPIQNVLESLLVPYVLTDAIDSRNWIGVLLQITAAADDDPTELVDVYRISPSEKRTRGTDDSGRISQLFMGAYPNSGPKIYPGDRELRNPDRLTVQIHAIDIFEGPTATGKLLRANVPVLAIWVPGRLGRGWLAQ